MYWKALTFLLVLLIYLVYMFFVKKRFKGQTVHYELWEILDDGTGVQRRGATDSMTLGFSIASFLPTRASTRLFHGLKLVAASGGTLYVAKESIERTVKKYGASAASPETKLRSISETLTKTKANENEKAEALDVELSGTPTYFQNDENCVWRIWVTKE